MVAGLFSINNVPLIVYISSLTLLRIMKIIYENISENIYEIIYEKEKESTGTLIWRPFPKYAKTANVTYVRTIHEIPKLLSVFIPSAVPST